MFGSMDRLRSLLKPLKQSPEKIEAHNNISKQFLQNVIEEVKRNDNQNLKDFHLPHSAVVKERVVTRFKSP